VTHSADYTQKPRRARGQGPARRAARTLAFVLPVMLVLSGTLAVTRVNWSGSSSDSILTASSQDVSARARSRAPQDVLRDRLLQELRAAVQAYGPARAQSYARPVCDTSFASGVAGFRA
jgi:hypothetical protein